MSEYSSLKATINSNVKTNGNQEITGSIMNSVLNAMVNSLGAGYQFIGVATPTNPGTAETPDYKCFYLATTPGTYTNLDGLVVADGEVAILKYDTSWTKEVTGIATADQLNQLGQKTYGGGSPFAKNENIPTALKCIRDVKIITNDASYANASYRLTYVWYNYSDMTLIRLEYCPNGGSWSIVKDINKGYPYTPTSNVEVFKISLGQKGAIFITVDWSKIESGDGYSYSGGNPSIINSNNIIYTPNGLLEPILFEDESISKNKLNTSLQTELANVNTPFAENNDSPSNFIYRIRDIKIISTESEDLNSEYAIQHFWYNSSGFGLFIRLMYKNGNSWTKLVDLGISTSYTPTHDVETFKWNITDKTTFVFTIDFSGVNSGESNNLTIIKNSCKVEPFIEKSNYFSFRSTIGKNMVAFTSALKWGYVLRYSDDDPNDTYLIAYLWRNSDNSGFFRISRVKADGTYEETFYQESISSLNTSVPQIYNVQDKLLFCIDWSQIPLGTTSNPIIYFVNSREQSKYSVQAAGGYNIKDTILSESNTIKVDANGNGDFTTITDAVAYVSSLCPAYDNQFEIVVYPGTYYENNIIVPPFTHIHGLRPNSVVVTSISQKDTTNLPVFDQLGGKLSNMKIISYTGYCIHFDQTNLKRLSICNENLHIVKAYAMQGKTTAIIGGGCQIGGVLYEWKYCTFEALNGIVTNVACHSNQRLFDNTTYKLVGCHFINCYLGLGCIGGFGRNVCEIEDCVFEKNMQSIMQWKGNHFIGDIPNAYLSNPNEWQVLAKNCKNFSPSLLTIDRGALFVEAASAVPGQEITIGGSAKEYIFGNIITQKGGTQIKASVLGTLFINDAQIESNDITQLWKRLGDCSTTNKELTIQIGSGTVQTYTFNEDYTASKPTISAILAALNNAFSGVVFSINDTINHFYENVISSEKVSIICNDANDILAYHIVSKSGETCTQNTPIDDVLGIALQNAVQGDELQVWTGKSFYLGLQDGNYAIASDGTLISSDTNVVGYSLNGVFTFV